MIDAFVESLSVLIENNVWIAPLLALVAGITTSFTPCSISTIPLIIGYVSGYSEGNTKKAFKLSLVFALGTAVTYTSLGVAAALLGNLMGFGGSLWYIFLGGLMLLMALQTWELINFIPSSVAVSANKKTGYLGALITGFLAGLFSSPCSTPVLVVLLAIVAGSGNLLYGILLLLLYSIGHSMLAVLSGTGTGFISQLKKSDKYIKFNKISKVVMGILIAGIGLYMLYLGF
jgi:cytochrome c biogenesis protein CcdA